MGINVLEGLLPVATVDKDGLMSKTYRKRIAYVKGTNINTSARIIARFSKGSGYYNSSIFLKIDSFQLSAIVLLRVNATNNIYSFGCEQLTNTMSNTSLKLLVVDSGNYNDVYITGSYVSSYSSGGILVMTTDSLAEAIEGADVVPVNSLSSKKEFVIGNN